MNLRKDGKEGLEEVRIHVQYSSRSVHDQCEVTRDHSRLPGAWVAPQAPKRCSSTLSRGWGWGGLYPPFLLTVPTTGTVEEVKCEAKSLSLALVSISLDVGASWINRRAPGSCLPVFEYINQAPEFGKQIEKCREASASNLPFFQASIHTWTTKSEKIDM